MVSITQRLSVATLVLALILISITETAANPGQEQHDVNSVADAIRYLQDLENRHQFARPRWEEKEKFSGTIKDQMINEDCFLINSWLLKARIHLFSNPFVTAFKEELFSRLSLFIFLQFPFHFPPSHLHRSFFISTYRNLSVHLKLMKTLHLMSNTSSQANSPCILSFDIRATLQYSREGFSCVFHFDVTWALSFAPKSFFNRTLTEGFDKLLRQKSQPLNLFGKF